MGRATRVLPLRDMWSMASAIGHRLFSGRRRQRARASRNNTGNCGSAKATGKLHATGSTTDTLPSTQTTSPGPVTSAPRNLMQVSTPLTPVVPAIPALALAPLSQDIPAAIATSRPLTPPPPCLKSPRALLRALVPSDVAQTRRMDLALLQEAPKWCDLTRAAWNGCSHANRAHVWRLLIGYEPLMFAARESTLHAKRARYRHYVRALYAPLGRLHFDCASPICTLEVNNLDVYNVDHDDYITNMDYCTGLENIHDNHNSPHDRRPQQRHKQNLSPYQLQQAQDLVQRAGSPLSCERHVIEYSSFSAKTLRQIEMDLPRTHPHLPIFHVDQVRDPMRRILYIFGMLNPNNNYVQGMNEILSAILVVFLAERVGDAEASSINAFLVRPNLHGVLSQQQLADAEADAFWMFSAIISTVGDNFVADQPGILRRVARLEEIVARVDPTLMAHLAANGNDFLQFAFRWMNCLLMRELPFQLVVKLWDALLAYPDGIADFHVYFCAAMLTYFADELVEMDFEECMIFLQHLPTDSWTEDNVDELLSQAFIWKNTLDFDSLAS